MSLWPAKNRAVSLSWSPTWSPDQGSSGAVVFTPWFLAALMAPPPPWEWPVLPTLAVSTRWKKRLPLCPFHWLSWVRPCSISLPLPAFDVLAAATMKPCDARWRSSAS